jgi:hypothetical protein
LRHWRALIRCWAQNSTSALLYRIFDRLPEARTTRAGARP